MRLNRKPFTVFVLATILLQVLLPSSALASYIETDGSLPDETGLQGLLAPQAGPVITLFYGTTQSFGQVGQPQNQINVLGNVSDPDGVSSLTYTLNGGFQKPLSIGPDTRRLLRAGDFNVELFDEELNQGPNTVVITATDAISETTSTTVTVNYDRTQAWPLPYQTDWTAGIQSQAQVVDGEWEVQSGGLHTVEVGYDRLVAIGDIGWKDYEVTVPITITSVDPAGYLPPSYGPALGIIMRWTGNTDDPVPGEQPKEGWWPLGAIGWFRWQEAWTTPRLQIFGNNDYVLAESSGKIPVIGATYVFKMRVETTVNGPQYRLKVWRVEVPEPADWDLTGTGNPMDPSNGSLVLLAHHIEATFGNVQVTRLGSPPPPSTIVSDDFNRCNLDEGLWSFINPVAGGDATQMINNPFTNNAVLDISVPAGSDHDLLPNNNRSARVMQPANDTDFEVEAKFESGVDPQYQMQGILVEESSSKYLRFEFHGDGVNTRIYTASYVGTDKTVIYEANLGLPGIKPLYMRVKRADHRWVQSYSTDGTNWHSIRSFSAPLTVNDVGVYAANAMGVTSPQFNGQIDYFFNRAAPVVPEDGNHQQPTLSVFKTGNGNVTVDPEQTSYSCNTEVSLEAVPAPGWAFADWSGDLTGNSNPITLTMDTGKSVTANFDAIPYQVTASVLGQGSVAVDPEKATYQYGDVITLTATADPGWSFDSWGGGLTGKTNPVSTTVTGDLALTATFLQEVYALDITTSGQGSVAVDFEGPYHYGDQVELTATPEPGWVFDGWGGDLSGRTNPITTTITGDLTVSAAFLQKVLAVNITILGQGGVGVVPEKATYQYGDVITLTATADPGWIFAGWGGDLSGQTNPITTTVNGDLAVTATFVQQDYTLNITTSGQGSVTADVEGPYHYGDHVKLTAAPDQGWSFTGWSGAVIETQNPITITITGDMNIHANFSTVLPEYHYYLFLPVMDD